jgi:hypothetical protein
VRIMEYSTLTRNQVHANDADTANKKFNWS